MRNEFVTHFWQRAYESLPAGVRGQYLTQMKAAERWELSLKSFLEFASRARNAVSKVFQAPKGAH
ncbi:MAG TPA: hypothetical protein VL982_04375 [Burkholderiales bacterium]|nr:hypothetical protein [Burkholderiales bacterium]